MNETEVLLKTHQFLKSQPLERQSVVRLFTDVHSTLLPHPALAPFQRFTLDMGDFVVHPDIVSWGMEKRSSRADVGCLGAARAPGRVGGRPKALDNTEVELLHKLRDEKEHTVKEICQMLGISKPTCYAYLNQRNTK